MANLFSPTKQRPLRGSSAGRALNGELATNVIYRSLGKDDQDVSSESKSRELLNFDQRHYRCRLPLLLCYSLRSLPLVVMLRLRLVGCGCLSRGANALA